MVRKRKSPFDWFWDDKWFDDFFSQLTEDMKRMMEQFKTFEPEKLEALPNVSGFSMRIVSDGKNPPRVEVSRMGPKGITPLKGEKPWSVDKKEEKKTRLKKLKHQPEKFEEAPYTYNLDVNRVSIELKVGGVENEENVELNFRPESLEIRAYVPKTKKGYFTILKLPPNVDESRAEIKVDKDKVTITIPRKYPVPESGR